MLRVVGIKKQSDVELIKEFTNFVLARFLTPEQIKKAYITIKYVTADDLSDPDDLKSLKSDEAWCVQDPNNKAYQIYIAKSAISKTAITPLTRLKKTLGWIAHELVHVKQYALGEMADVHNRNGEVIATKYKGVIYPDMEGKLAANLIKAKWAYYELPYEIEAYGRAEGLLDMFIRERGDKWLTP